jgi:hypothetical protein
VTLGEILDKCGNETDGGQGIYTLLHLEAKYDVDTLKNWQIDYNISLAIDEFHSQIGVRKFSTVEPVYCGNCGQEQN